VLRTNLIAELIVSCVMVCVNQRIIQMIKRGTEMLFETAKLGLSIKVVYNTTCFKMGWGFVRSCRMYTL